MSEPKRLTAAELIKRLNDYADEQDEIDMRENHVGDYELLRDAIIALLDPPDDDAAEEAILIAAVERCKAERDALAAEIARFRATLAPAWEADEGATTPGAWAERENDENPVGEFWIEADSGGVVCFDTGLHMWPREKDVTLACAAVNAIRAARIALGEEPTP